MTVSSITWTIAGGLWVGLWALSAVLYPGLPEQIPGHYGLDGQVTRWDDRSSFWLLPVVGTFVLGLVFVLTRLAYSNLDVLNIPNKQAFLALSAEAQHRVLSRLDVYLAGLTGLSVGLFAYLQWHTSRVAAGKASGAELEWVFVVVTLPLIGWMIVDVSRSIHQESRVKA